MTSTTVRPLLEVDELRAGYGRIEVLHGVSFSVAPRTVTALLGPNGAGKTTTLHVLAGLHPAASGTVHIAGRRANGIRADDLARCGVCLIPEGRGIFPNLTVRENLRVATNTGRAFGEIEDDTYQRFPRLGERRSQIAGTMSGGEQQMLALARGIATRPAVLLLDELSMGLAPLIVAQLYEEVARIAREGVAVLVVEQFANVVLGVSDHAHVMLRGRIAASGTPREIEHRLADVYLGGSDD